ncbi:PcfJ domain-containing protein [Flavobacterium sp. UBA7682]|uniref:PcfJ domain-containing protein n=1 Tax=Flavobacterium sp. UBA7682 TaxID=1946560 RepID=UPI0025BBCE89|nr:PcfJ domain-containing protein [Flavobacterium sp. UBA7682]
MKPKTALEIKIVELSKNLPQVTQQQNELAFAKCFDNYAVQSRKNLFCLECGHNWKVADTKKLKKITCEKCSKRLLVTDKYNNGLKETDYYQIITTADKFQIVRMICITKTMRKNCQCFHFAHEVMQIFIDESGKTRTMSKNVMGLSQYFDQWIISSELSLKINDNNSRFYLRPSFVQPNKKVLPVVKRNGFNGKFYGIAPQILFKAILSDSIAETLLKTKQHNMLYYHIRNTSLKPTGIYWNAIKICIRNSYNISDAKFWIDYIDLLQHFMKDIRSPKYVCPLDLKKAHDKLMAKKVKEIWKNTVEENKKQIGKNQRHYFKAKKQFFGLVFTEKNISINVIETIKEFLEEGCIHNHCVFTNEYYKKQNSLILSAKVNGVHAETIQISLENLEILQSRGRGNKATRYNKEIIKLVSKNLPQIRARMKTAC